MKESAEMLHEKYKSKLATLDETERAIKAQLDARTEELDEQMKSVKMLIFDAKMQYKSNEISESTFESVKTQTSDLIEHITHEQAEISKVQRRLDDLNIEVKSTEAPRQQIQEEAISYLDTQSESEVQTKLPEVPEHNSVTSFHQQSEQISQPIIAKQPVSATPNTNSTPNTNTKESDWLARMEAQ
jgi:chromosome segregation ATPase